MAGAVMSGCWQRDTDALRVNIVAPPHIFQRLHFHKATRAEGSNAKMSLFLCARGSFPNTRRGKKRQKREPGKEKKREIRKHTHELTHFLIAPRVQFERQAHLYIFLFRPIRRAEEGRDYRIRSQSCVGAHFFNDCGACVPLDWFNNAWLPPTPPLLPAESAERDRRSERKSGGGSPLFLRPHLNA